MMIHTDEQTNRIALMEQHLDRATAAVRQLEAALGQYEAAQESINALDHYYGSTAWREDYGLDEAGLLPEGLKRGVLAEDTIWNLMEELREVKRRGNTLLK